jgi:hypothetical protein
MDNRLRDGGEVSLTRRLAALDPKKILGSHLNSLIVMHICRIILRFLLRTGIVVVVKWRTVMAPEDGRDMEYKSHYN